MDNLEEIAKEIQANLDEKDEIREVALKSSRAILRLSGSALRQMQKGEDESENLQAARNEAHRLTGVLEGHPDIYYSGFVENAFQELTEAHVLRNILRGERIRDPKEVGVHPIAYLLGLGDVVGELRRLALNSLINGGVKKAKDCLEKMETIYDILIRFDYPSALVPIRRKQDIARSLIEKTRGEIAVASTSSALEAKIGNLEKKI
ncbi:MAG: translin family protein [Methanomassiliicoccales archaeon]|nr:MAG: translin family protein [Methanomassiliicoccales archaeon]